MWSAHSTVRVEVLGHLCVGFVLSLHLEHGFQALDSGRLACAATDFLLSHFAGSGDYLS